MSGAHPGVLAPGSGNPHAPRRGQVAAVRTRPPEWEAPVGTIAEVSAWLLGPARDMEKAPEAFDEFCWRVLGAGLAIARATLHVGTLDPQFFGYALIWWRELRRTEYILARHELRDTATFRDSPIAHALEHEITIRRRLEGNNVVLDFPVLAELREQGITDYIVLTVRGGHGRRHVGSYATDRPGGFTSDDLDVLTQLAGLMGILIDHFTLEQSARNVIQAYLGPKAGPRVLAGQIRRGSGERMRAVIWLSDIRGFTALSERLDGERVIAILNACFDAQAIAIAAHGGEILKFMGDGILAIFPIADDGAMPEAVRAAAQAAHAGLAAIATLNESELLAGEKLRVVCALHAGEVFYGNIGAADRLDFTVIGPAVNLVSRTVEAAKALDVDLVVSDVFAAAHGDGPLRSLGKHVLRGLEGARELFTILTSER
jgi:adenylate cyclase